MSLFKREVVNLGKTSKNECLSISVDIGILNLINFSIMLNGICHIECADEIHDLSIETDLVERFES